MNTLNASTISTNRHYLKVVCRKHVNIISMDMLVRVEAWSNYSRLFLTDGRTLVVPRVLKQIEKRLDSRLFIRSHYTHLINLDFLAGFNAAGDLVMVNGECIPVSRRRKISVKRCLENRLEPTTNR
jgi:two-component system, LytTR family, response regulator